MKRAALCSLLVIVASCNQLQPANAPAVAVEQSAIGGPPTVPTGALMPFAGSAAPSGYFLCDGSAVDRGTYSALFTVIGTTYGAGDGSTTFNLPDLRGRTAFGKDDMNNTTAAGRLTTTGSGLDGKTLGASGGSENHVLSPNEMPSHTHAASDSGHVHESLSVAGYPYRQISNSNQGIPQGTFWGMPIVGFGLCETGRCDWGAVYGYGDLLGYENNGYSTWNGVSSYQYENTSLGYANVHVQPTGGGAGHATVSPGVVLNYIIKS